MQRAKHGGLQCGAQVAEPVKSERFRVHRTGAIEGWNDVGQGRGTKASSRALAI